jgi:hypothetical protein
VSRGRNPDTASLSSERRISEEQRRREAERREHEGAVERRGLTRGLAHAAQAAGLDFDDPADRPALRRLARDLTAALTDRPLRPTDDDDDEQEDPP